MLLAVFIFFLTVVLLKAVAVLWYHLFVLWKRAATVIFNFQHNTESVKCSGTAPQKRLQPTLKYESCAMMQLLGICSCRLLERVDFPPLVILKDKKYPPLGSCKWHTCILCPSWIPYCVEPKPQKISLYFSFYIPTSPLYSSRSLFMGDKKMHHIYFLSLLQFLGIILKMLVYMKEGILTIHNSNNKNM